MLVARHEDVVIEHWGMTQRWLPLCWSGGHFIGRPAGVFGSVMSATQAASEWLGSAEARMSIVAQGGLEIDLPSIVKDLLIRSPTTKTLQRAPAAFLAEAFGARALQLDRLRWHGLVPKLLVDPAVPSHAERLQALSSYLGEARGLSSHERMALHAAARAVGLLGLPPTDAAPPGNRLDETAETRPLKGPMGNVAAFAMAMLDGVSSAAGPDAWLTLDEVAGLLKLERTTVECLLEDGLLGHVAIPQRNGDTIVRVLPRHLDELARDFSGGRSCRNGAARRSHLGPSSSSEPVVGIGMSSGMIPSRVEVAGGPPAPSIAPQLKVSGRGCAPVGPKRPIRKGGTKGLSANG